MQKEDEIKLLDEMQTAFLKLLNAKDGYIKDQFKEVINLSILKADLERMAKNIQSDFMPFIFTKLNRIIFIHKERVAQYRKMATKNIFVKNQLEGLYNDEKKKNAELNTFLSMVLEYVLEEQQTALLEKFNIFNRIAVMKMKIDKGIELSPKEKEFVKQSIS